MHSISKCLAVALYFAVALQALPSFSNTNIGLLNDESLTGSTIHRRGRYYSYGPSGDYRRKGNNNNSSDYSNGGNSGSDNEGYNQSGSGKRKSKGNNNSSYGENTKNSSNNDDNNDDSEGSDYGSQSSTGSKKKQNNDDSATSTDGSKKNSKETEGNTGSGKLEFRFHNGQCTDWADARYAQLTGHHISWSGDARTWASKARSASGWTVSATPKQPSIIVIQPGVQGTGSPGHVAVVEKIDSSGSVSTSNYNYNGGPYIQKSATFKTGNGVDFIWFN
ncbi:hypothetical protein K7432_005995 [Basidiobolus ranarum]|uniref:Peptidase C51 domain-containing protein n=1 Tax=Basidiobolus ranarum TaxID=34480 RepID=A0ABR2WVK8_9FUNG